MSVLRPSRPSRVCKRAACRTSAKLGAAGAFSTENIKLIEDLVGRVPITTKQFAEDFKALFS